MVYLHSWHLLQRKPPRVKINGQVITLSPRYFDTLFGEWFSWKTAYLPRFNVKGMTFLDVGAGCGETALFYFSLGAAKVICVEPDRENMEMLRNNALRNGWNVETILGGFEPEMLEWKFDFMKMDCEGCEKTLLDLKSLPPCAIEVHGSETYRRFVDRFHVRTVSKDRETWIVQSS